MEVKKSMPSQNVLIEKKKTVEELTAKLKCKTGVFVNYSGITVNEDTALRVKMREANVDYSVIKNSLMKFAIKNAGFEELEPILIGTTSLAVSDTDPVAPARIIKEYADKLPNYFNIKGGFMDGKILSIEEVNAIAIIPPLPILHAQLLGTMLAPIASLAVVLKLIAEKGGAPVDVEVEAPVAAVAEEPAPAAAVEVPAAVAAEEPAPAAAVEEPAAAVAAEEPAPAVAVEEPAAAVVEEPTAAAAKETVEKAPAKPRSKKAAAETPPAE